ncbi:MAG TPA: hypothetical protein VE197_12555 [Mycobacterium sp.]|nr:hypothetical protein [Mycobacterium sp.]
MSDRLPHAPTVRSPHYNRPRAVSALLATVRTLATKRATMEKDDRMLVRQHERWVEELSVQLQLDKPITARGSVLALPAAHPGPAGRMGDQREFLPVQYDD